MVAEAVSAGKKLSHMDSLSDIFTSVRGMSGSINPPILEENLLHRILVRLK